MGGSRVRIGELSIADADLTREQATRVAVDVARRLGAAISDGIDPQPLGALHVRVAPGVSRERLAEEIASAIVRGLR
jgi:hypothetical protein